MPSRRPPQQTTPREEREFVDEAVAVVIVNHRTPKLTAKCLAALEHERSALRKFQVFVVDGGSEDGSAEELSELVKQSEYRDWVDFLALPLNGGFGWANNQAIQRLMRADEPPQYIHLLNPDAQIEADAVRSLAEYLESHPRAAAVGSQLLEPDGSWTGSAFNFPSIRGEFSRGARTGALDRLLRVPPISIQTSDRTEVDWVTGASVMFRVDALRQVGLFDDGFFLYNEEIELMWRLRQAGWRIAIQPRSRVRHVGGAATGMTDRDAQPSMLPRRPRYWYRSRTRYLTLTRGISFATLAFFAWLFGYLVWFVRRYIGLAPDGVPIDHALRDHLANSFPRRRDAMPAIRRWDGPLDDAPAWMKRGAW